MTSTPTTPTNVKLSGALEACCGGHISDQRIMALHSRGHGIETIASLSGWSVAHVKWRIKAVMGLYEKWQTSQMTLEEIRALWRPLHKDRVFYGSPYGAGGEWQGTTNATDYRVEESSV